MEDESTSWSRGMEQGLPDERNALAMVKDRLIEIEAHVKFAWSELLKIEKEPTDEARCVFEAHVRAIQDKIQFVSDWGPGARCYPRKGGERWLP